jgi:hypothetical protein
MGNKTIFDRDDSGNEVIKSLDDEGKETGLVLTLSDLYEDRKIEDIDAKTILDVEEVAELSNTIPIKSGRKTRLEHNNVDITHRETGEGWVIKMGNVPTLEARRAKDITGSWLILENIITKETLNVIVPYKKDGTIPETFQFNITERVTNEHT